MYEKSYTCRRELLPDDPLLMDFTMIKQCTQASEEDFNAFIEYAHKWIYYAPTRANSASLKCIDDIAVTGSKQLGNVQMKGNYLMSIMSGSAGLILQSVLIVIVNLLIIN